MVAPPVPKHLTTEYGTVVVQLPKRLILYIPLWLVHATNDDDQNTYSPDLKECHSLMRQIAMQPWGEVVA